jgi:hypothetical protein
MAKRLTPKRDRVESIIEILKETQVRLRKINGSDFNTWDLEGFIESVEENIFDLNAEIESED